MSNSETAKKANELLAEYIADSHYFTKGYDISEMDNGDEINGVFADYRAYCPSQKKYVYFEVKGSTVRYPLWGAITHKELKSAIGARSDKYLYYFVVIHINKKGEWHFVHPSRTKQDVFSNFMTIEEIMGFSKRAKIAVDFEMNCSDSFDNPQIISFVIKKDDHSQ